ncbi:aminoglycoside 6-adenylyltransferase [Providencia alcalifaciens]|nr:aminoglycoside 6-adenylyltransferase [Providencia alcalifaciens]
MESPATLINKIISVSLLDPRIEAVVLTGSRGREHGVDSYSDIDIELIGFGATEIFHEQHWVNHFADPIIALHLENKGENDPDWPTCLVIFEQGRKVDFTFAEPVRLQQMKQYGLDSTYSRGYTVLLDKTGITEGVADSSQTSIAPKLLSEAQFNDLWANFWFESHQVAIALARDELWSAWSRNVDMKNALLTLAEYLISIKSDGKQDVWYHGKHYHQWMPSNVLSSMETLFDYRNTEKASYSLFELMNCFDEVATEIASQLNYAIDRTMNQAMQTFVTSLLQDNGLLPEEL